MKRSIFRYLFFIISFVLCASCTKEIDFDQVNDIEISPVLESSLIFFDASAGEFLIGGIEVDSATAINDNLVKVDFVFEGLNSINRAYQIKIDFLNGFGVLVHSFDFMAVASVTNSENPFAYTETYEGDTLDDLKATRIMVFTLTMLDGDPIDNNTPGNIQLESKGVFYLNIEG